MIKEVFLLLCVAVGAIYGIPVDIPTGSHFWEDDLENYFQDLIDDNRYGGGVLGVIKNGRMVFSRAYGTIGDRNLHPTTIMPISSISKTLTAVAILQLAEQGYLGLEDEVFGEEGLLSFIKPVSGLPVDKRIQDITVDHLLRHAAGWVETHAPVYDPMMNEVYLEIGDTKVVDIAKAMNVDGMMNQYDLIRFVITTPLEFTPGTRSAYSNFGYCVLGRVIEEVTGVSYEHYIKKNILIPAGMTHTRLGPRFEDEDIVLQYEDGDLMNSQFIHNIVYPEFLDSTLGWYSNVYDLSRFVGCLLGQNGCSLLRTDSVQYLMEKPPLPDLIHDRQWEGISMIVTEEGAIWQDSYKHDNDVILFHKGAHRSKLFNNFANDLSENNDNVTIIAMMSKNRMKRLHSDVENMYKMVRDWPEEVMPNLMTQEISDLVLKANGSEVIVRYDLSEHHVEAYLHSLKLAGYYPTWIHAYTWDLTTSFLIIAKKATKPEDLKFQVLISHNTKKLYKKAADWEEEGYYVDLVDSYMSYSHMKGATHMVLLRYSDDISPDDVLWNLNVDLDEYYMDMEDAMKRGFSVISQSVDSHGKKEHVSYIFRKRDGPFIAYHDVDHDRLEQLLKSQSMTDYRLEYLDSFREQKTPKFSAVFQQNPYKKWAVQTDMNPDTLGEQILIWYNSGYMPEIIIGYEKKDYSKSYMGCFSTQ